MWGIELIGHLNEEEKKVTLETPKEIIADVPEQTASYWQSRCKRAEDKLNRITRIISGWNATSGEDAYKAMYDIDNIVDEDV